LRPAAAIFAALVAWGALSAAWSIDPGRSLVLDARITGLFAAALALAGAPSRVASPRRLFLCVLAGTAIGSVLAGYDMASAGGLNQWVSTRPFIAPRLNPLAVWLAIEGGRSAPVGTSGGAGSAWAEYALRAPVMCIRVSEDEFVPVCEPLTFAGTTQSVSAPVIAIIAFAAGAFAVVLIVLGIRRLRHAGRKQLRERISTLQDENARLHTQRNLQNIVRIPEAAPEPATAEPSAAPTTSEGSAPEGSPPETSPAETPKAETRPDQPASQW